MIRALPILIIFMVMMIGSKVLEVLEVVPSMLSVIPLHAAESPKETPKADEAKKEEKPEGKTEGKAEAKTEGKAEAKTEEEIKAEGAKKEAENQELVRTNHEKSIFSPSEVLILQELANRRKQLDQREKEISIKENSLNVIEANIHEKILTLQQLQEKLKFVLSQYEMKEDEKIKSLVKVYEAMKPADAAKIFEKLEMPILLSVSSHMKEAKLAMIFSKMDPSLAKELTIELANFRKVQGID